MNKHDWPLTGGTMEGTGTNEAHYQSQSDYTRFSADYHAFPVAEVLRHGSANDAEREWYLNGLARRERGIGKTRAAVAATRQMRIGGDC